MWKYSIFIFILGFLAGLIVGFFATSILLSVPGHSFNYVAPAAEVPNYQIIKATITKYVLRGTMANGEQVHLGAIACPRRIKLGTKVLIDGQEYICKDRLAKRYDDRFDIWEPDYDVAIQWGKQNKDVAIVF